MVEFLREHEVHGDLRAELTRPPMRFGYALYLLATTKAGDVTHVGRVGSGGYLVFEPHEPYALLSEPTMYLSEEAVAAFKAAFAQVPGPVDDGVRAHLADTITTRDRLLALVEHAQHPIAFDELPRPQKEGKS